MHQHPHDTNQRIQQANRITLLGIVVNVLLTIFQIAAGIVGKSEAIIADAFHTLSDLSTDFVVIWGFWASGKPVDEDHDYGHGKIETLLSTSIGLTLLAVGGGILWHAGADILKAVRGELLVEPKWIAFWAAVSAVVGKEWLYRRTVIIGKRINSPAIIAKAWHHRSDSFSSIAVMVGIGGAILLGDRWAILDPITAVAVSFFILQMAFSITWTSVNELIEASLGDEAKAEIIKIVNSIPGAAYPHNLRTRRIGKDVAMEIHIQVDRTLNIVQAHDIATEVEDRLKDRFGKEAFISVHVEPLK